MGLPGFVYYGGANTTTSEHITSPQADVGMTSTGSTMAPQAIFILAFLMLVSWKGKHYLNYFNMFSICKIVNTVCLYL